MYLNAAFDVSAYVVAATWTYCRGSSGISFIDGSFRGTQSFAIVSLFDKAIRFLLARNVKAESTSVADTLLSPLIEEALYSGVLLTQSKMWMIPRLVASLATGMTAARALTGRVTSEQYKQGFTLDTKIGFLWAVSRELLLHSVSSPILSTILTVADSCVFALSEVSPKKGRADLPQFTSRWCYKLISSVFFRFAAYDVAKTHGIVAPIVQHLLFNASVALGNRSSIQTQTLKVQH